MVQLKEIFYAKPLAQNQGSDNPRSDFLDQLRIEGYRPDNIIRVGELMRIPDKEDSGSKKTGWYVYHEIEDLRTEGRWIGIGVYNSWRSGEDDKKWSSKSYNFLSLPERQEYNRIIKETIAKNAAEKLQFQQERAAYAKEIWESATPVKETSYTLRKKIDRSDFRITKDGRLIVPAYIDEKISSLQFIADDGEKKFLYGTRMQGAWHYLRGDIDTVYICEGYATGCTINQITNKAVYVAFNAGNLVTVTNYAKDKHPDAQIIIAADDDIGNKVNTGRKTGQAAAEVCAVDVVFPEVPTDFNDMFCEVGFAETEKVLLQKTKQIERYVNPPEAVENIEIMEPPGILMDIVRFYNATALIQQPKFAIQTALAIGSLVCARNYATQYNNRTSLYFMNVAKSSQGKEHAKTVIGEVLTAAGLNDWIAGEGYTSRGAVFTTLFIKPKHVCIIDEFGRYLEHAKSAGGGNIKDSFTGLMTAWGTLHSYYKPQNYSNIRMKREEAEEMARLKIINPAITLLVMTQPDSLKDNISVRLIKDGELPRFLFAEADTVLTPPNIRRAKIAVPEKITRWIEDVLNRVDGKICSATEEPKIFVLGITDAATELFQEFVNELFYQHKDLERFQIAELTGKMNEISMRISMICALARDPFTEYVDVEDARWGIKYAKNSLNILIKFCKKFISGSDFERQKKEILEALRTAGEIKESDLTKRPPFSKYKPKDREEILRELIKSGLADMQIVKAKGRGRPAMYYFATAQKKDIDSEENLCNSANQREEGEGND